MMKIFNILLSLFILVSCANKQGKSDATFSLNFATTTFSDGGMMVYGKNKSRPGVFIGKRIVDTAQTFELLNGVWDFIAVTWTGPSIFEGDVKCAQVIDVTLGGKPVDVPLVFSENNCLYKIFGKLESKNATGGFKNLTINNCMNQQAIIDKNLSLTDCAQGSMNSVLVTLPAIRQDGAIVPFEGLRRCVNITGASDPTLLRMPFFDDLGSPIDQIFTPFKGSDCTDIAMGDLSIKQLTSKRIDYAFAAGSQVNELFIKTPYCFNGVPIKSTVVLTMVAGTQVSTHQVLCTPSDLAAIFPNVTGPVILGASIDLNGVDVAAIGGGARAVNNIFDGNGYLIDNIYINHGATLLTKPVGLITNVTPTLNVAIVRNLVVRGKVYVAGDAQGKPISLAIGQVDGGALVENVLVLNSKMDIGDVSSLESDIGFAIGFGALTSNVDKLYVAGSDIYIGPVGVSKVDIIWGKILGIVTNKSAINSNIYYK